jgi:EAL domain-containing protein (putative c-di-GMP-specific phosphodiesterase class I)
MGPLPSIAIPAVEHQPTMAVDTTLPVDVRDVIWIRCVDATTQGVHGRDVLVRTISDTVRLVPSVSFLALVGQKGIVERLRVIMRSHAYDGALHLQRTCRSVPMCSVWTNHLQLEDIVPNEGERCLLEGGIECPLTCVRTFSSK